MYYCMILSILFLFFCLLLFHVLFTVVLCFDRHLSHHIKFACLLAYEASHGLSATAELLVLQCQYDKMSLLAISMEWWMARPLLSLSDDSASTSTSTTDFTLLIALGFLLLSVATWSRHRLFFLNLSLVHFRGFLALSSPTLGGAGLGVRCGKDEYWDSCRHQSTTASC